MSDIGDLVKLITKEGEKQGILMPSTEKDLIIIKLESGYNLCLSKSKVKSVKTIKKASKSKTTSKKLLKHKGLKNITILHTGGTIASKVDYKTGGTTSKFTPEEVVALYPELEELVNVNARLVGNMFSEDLRFAHYNLLAKEIAKEAKKQDAVIITHGTDTIALTACALSFILEHINIPVILVGAQRSSDRGSSDAGMNLIKACEFISKTDFVGVGICMHETPEDKNCLILPPCKTKKFHTSRRDAFKPVNARPIARVGEDVAFFDNHTKFDPQRKLKVKPIKENLKIGILKAHPNMFPEEIRFYEKFHGLILEGWGIAGNFPINKTDDLNKNHTSIYRELKKLANKIPVVTTSQTTFGRIQMNVYTTGRKMQEANILGNYTDMLPEVAHIKLAWLLSNEKNKIKELISTNLRGEISSRTEFEEKEI